MNNPPAFPQAHDIASGDPRWQDSSEVWGMTLHDYFAAAAITGLLANQRASEDWINQHLVKSARWVADAMLKARASQ